MKEKINLFSIGDSVEWKWMGRFIKGSVIEIYTESVSKTIKGKMIKRNGSRENPAYLVQSTAGNLALKLNSEVQIANPIDPRRPRMFSDEK